MILNCSRDNNLRWVIIQHTLGITLLSYIILGIISEYISSTFFSIDFG